MTELRYILVALGGIAIAALLIHGLWSNRKNRLGPINEKPIGRTDTKSRVREDNSFDSFDDDIDQRRGMADGRRSESTLRREESRLPERPRRAALAEFDDEPEDLLPPVRRPVARPVAPPVYQEEEAFDEPQVAVVEESEPAPVRKPAQVNRRKPVYRSRPQHEPAPAIDKAGLVEPAYASAPTFGSRASTPHQEGAVREAPRQASAPTPAMPTYQPKARYAAPEPEYAAPAAVSAPVAAPPRRPTRPVEKIWQDVYVINVMARAGTELQGTALQTSLMDLAFEFGERDLFHRHDQNTGEELFSMINMVKPGFFNPAQMGHLSTPGVSLFMQLPLHANVAFAFEAMLEAADQLAYDLGATLMDRNRSPLSDETITRYRYELAAYEASRS
ncbi:MAG: cell division protein ZipA [Aeromonas sp.]